MFQSFSKISHSFSKQLFKKAHSIETCSWKKQARIGTIKPFQCEHTLNWSKKNYKRKVHFFVCFQLIKKKK